VADGFSLAWQGLRSVEAAFTKVSADADTAARSIVAKGAAVVEAAAKANFQGSHKRGEPHVGGSKPNVVTGTLRRSIRTDPIVRYGLGEYGTRVAPSTVYARRVELGYPGGGKGAGRGHGHTNPHPYFTPAVDSTRPQLEALAAAEWRRFLHP
jgi:HK97 gp10 family phage protein